MPIINTDNHYLLNTKQLALLRLLYRFRFATSAHLAIALGLKLSTINQRLQILLDQKYIGRNYDGNYKIHGKPAEYYLLPNGIAALKQYMRDKCDDKVLHNIYKDKNAKPSSIAHSLDVFSVYCSLKERYGDKLRFFSKSQIYSYKHFPAQLPDAFIRLDVNGKQKEFFLEVIDPNKPFFLYVGKVRRYIEYSDDSSWQDAMKTKMPTVLVVSGTIGTQVRFQKQAARFLKRHYEDEPKIYTTNTEKLEAIVNPGHDEIWRNAEEPEQVVSLQQI
jgi:DNA-binding MarR family transcriptional regulator